MISLINYSDFLPLGQIWLKKGQDCKQMGHMCQFWPLFITTIYVVLYIIPTNIYKLHGSRFGNNSYMKSIFHSFVWNIHKCYWSICIVWTLMSCTLLQHKCHMPIHIIYTLMLYVYSCCLHTKIMHMIFMFK